MAVYPGEGWRGQNDKVSGNHAVEQGLQSWDAYGVGWLVTEIQIKGLKQKTWVFIGSPNWPLAIDPELQQCHQDAVSLDSSIA